MNDRCRWCGIGLVVARHDAFGGYCEIHGPGPDGAVANTARLAALLKRIEEREDDHRRHDLAIAELEAKVEQPDWKERR